MRFQMENGMFLQLAQGLLSSPGTAIESLAEVDIGGLPLMDGLSEFCSDNLSGCNYLSYHNKVETTPNILRKRKCLV